MQTQICNLVKIKNVAFIRELIGQFASSLLNNSKTIKAIFAIWGLAELIVQLMRHDFIADKKKTLITAF